MNNIINQPWLGLLGLAIAISAALKALWETPFFTTFWVVMALYLGFSVWKQVKDGVTTALEGIQKAGVFAIAVVIFYILQKSLGVIERALGPVGEKDQELLFIWGLIAALIAGGLADQAKAWNGDSSSRSCLHPPHPPAWVPKIHRHVGESG